MRKADVGTYKKVIYSKIVLSSLLGLGIQACSTKPVDGPDKTFVGETTGAAQGAGAGAVIGLHVGAGTGPGALVGAGFGAVAGAVNGLIEDSSEERTIALERHIKLQRERGIAQQKLTDHYRRRMELHPTRDIFPADLFFDGDAAQMCPSGKNLVREIAAMNEYRLPSSRLIVAVYAKSADPNSTYARYLTERRSRELVNQMVRAGIEPRRLETRSVVVDAPLLIDPLDNPGRYNQAVEIIPIDR